MALTIDCPSNWEYADHAASESILLKFNTSLLIGIRQFTPLILAAWAADTRYVHKKLFYNLTPPGFPYFAGHYRGENFRCLVDYEVGIVSDSNVGHTAATVPMEMTDFEKLVSRACQEIDFLYSVRSTLLSDADKLFRSVQICASLFVYFLEIHPYANGNGHAARFLLIALLGRKAIWLNSKWPLHPRPDDPEYSDAIKLYRQNNKAKLHTLLLNCL